MSKALPKQLTFDLPAKPALGRDDFFVSPSNAVAVKALESWSDWPQRKFVLCGAEGAGKTHLAHVWAADTGANVVDAGAVDLAAIDPNTCLLVEDIHLIAGQPAQEEALFHLHNMMQTGTGALLMTSTAAPNRLRFMLPDLASRLQATPVATIEEPDDALLAVLLVKLFADRQITVGPALIQYIARRMDRSFDMAHALVAALDKRALAEKRAITQSLAAQVLDKLSVDGA